MTLSSHSLALWNLPPAHYKELSSSLAAGGLATIVDEMVTLRTRTFMTRRLLPRKLVVGDIFSPGKVTARRTEAQGKRARTHKATPDAILGFRTHLDGGETTNFGMIYDSLDCEGKTKQNKNKTTTKMNANIDLLSTACIRRKRPQKSGDREGHSALADKRRKGASVSSSAAIKQIFHETLNK